MAYLRIFPPRSMVFSGRSFLKKKVFCKQNAVKFYNTTSNTYLSVQNDSSSFIDPQVLLNQTAILNRQQTISKTYQTVWRGHGCHLSGKTCNRQDYVYDWTGPGPGGVTIWYTSIHTFANARVPIAALTDIITRGQSLVLRHSCIEYSRRLRSHMLSVFR